MEIALEDRKKINEIFKVLAFSKKEISEHMDKLGERLLMDVIAEALVRNEFAFDESVKTKDDVAKFLLENFEEAEIKSLTDVVFRDVVVEYFSKILKNVSEDKKDEVEEILNSIE